MKTSDIAPGSFSSSLPRHGGMLLTFLLVASGCDKMKQMIDPTGQAYGEKIAPATTPAPSAPSTNPSPSAPAPASSAGPSAPGFEAPVREKAAGRFLTESVVTEQLDAIDFSAGGRTFRLSRGLHRDRGGIVSAVDSSGRPWGVAVGDLNMDGSDDAVVLLRADKPMGVVVWDLAYLPNRNGRLHNVQTIRLPGDEGFGEVVIEGSGVLLTPANEGHNVHLGYIGGELVLSSP